MLLKISSLLLLILMLSLSASAQTLTYEQLGQTLQAHNASNKTKYLRTLSEAALISEAKQILVSDTYPTIVKEHLLYEISLKLGQLPRSAANNDLAKELLGYDSLVKIQQFDGGHKQAWLAYPIAANIRAVKHNWQLQEQLSVFEQGIAFDIQQFLKHLQQDGNSQHRELLDMALDKMDVVTIAKLSAEIKGNWMALDSQYLLKIARASADADLFLSGLQQLNVDNNSSFPLNALTNLSTIWSDDELTQILSAMLSLELYPSLVMQQVAKLPQIPTEIRPQLLSLLGDRRLGGDAAFVIAKHMDTEFLMAMEELLQSNHKVSKRRALLALKLSDNEHAKMILVSHFKREPNPDLRQEVLP